MIKVIEEEVFRNFALKNEYISIYQLPEWGTLKQGTGWHRHLLGYYEKDTLLGVTMVLEKKMPLHLSLFYSPRGYLVDVKNFELLKKFHEEVIKYVKNNHGFMLKVDPNVIYETRDSDGNIKECVGKDIFDNFQKLGFKHLGFSQNFEDLQPRNLCRIELKETYDETLNTFSKSTKKNIDKTYDMGVRVKVVDEKEMKLFVHLLEETATQKNFVIRPVSYYKKMYELMKDYITLYVAYIDTNLYYDYIYKTLETKQKELDNLNKEMTKINVGDKIRKRKSDLENGINKLNKELEKAKELKKSNDCINIGALMSVFTGNEGITFMSGTSRAYKEFNPKYAFYREHIVDSINKHLKYVNFYGISLNMDKNGEYFGIYELKKGFNPEIIELIGEFDYILNPFVYHGYKLALKGYKVLKKVKSKLS